MYFLPFERTAVKTPRLLRDSWPIWSLQSGKHEWAALSDFMLHLSIFPGFTTLLAINEEYLPKGS